MVNWVAAAVWSMVFIYLASAIIIMGIVVNVTEIHLHLGQLPINMRMVRAVTRNKRQQIQTETGVCGLSILFELHKLYGFDPILDMTVDRMHLTFNMLKREFLSKMWADLGENAGKAINDRDPIAGGLIVHEEFKHALKYVTWTTEEKEKGVAKTTSLTDKLGSWKSNEFKR